MPAIRQWACPVMFANDTINAWPSTWRHKFAIGVTGRPMIWTPPGRCWMPARSVRRASFHLAIEKSFKARVVASTHDLPPRSHDLLLLAGRGGIALTDEQRNSLGRIQVYCLEGRYPTELPPQPEARDVAIDLRQAAEVVQWLIGPLSNP
jgi:hypothetical protein